MTQMRFLETANALGAKLCRDALWSGKYCNWYGPATRFVSNRWQTVRVTYGPTLYDGTSGIALFLASLYRLVEEPIYRRVALGAIHHALDHCAALPSAQQISFYSGWTGIAFTAIRLAELLNDTALADAGWQLVARATNCHPSEAALDLLTGCAGAIPAMLKLYRYRAMPSLLDAACELGKRLLDTATIEGETLSWRPDAVAKRGQVHHLLGYSHGASGMGLALLEVAQITQQEHLRVAATRAFAYERKYFREEWQNWPDLRPLNEPTPIHGTEATNMVAWCHGAAGIGLARLRAHAITNEVMYLEEAKVAISTTRMHLQRAMTSNVYNFSLCHGLAGNAELLVNGALYLAQTDLKDVADEVGDFGIVHHHAEDRVWPSGLRDTVEVPGLMLGLAGTGYFYLRLFDPTLPSLCLVEPS